MPKQEDQIDEINLNRRDQFFIKKRGFDNEVLGSNFACGSRHILCSRACSMRATSRMVIASMDTTVHGCKECWDWLLF